jgi:septal ring factor EnvC (AmiA/AmiB activator)
MILRRPSRLDPGHVLGSALAIALPFGAALAQQPATPQLPAQATPPKADPDTIKQRDQELEAARTEQRKSAENQARLKREIETLSEDRRKFNQQLIDTATRVRSVETGIGAIEARLKPLDASEATIQKSLDERRSVIAEILAALQRIGRQPPPALLVRPEDALQAVRTAITLGAVLPGMRAQAEALAGDLGDLLRVRKQIALDRARLSRELANLGNEQLRMNLLIDQRQKNQAEAEKALDTERQRAAGLARQVDNLKDLIAKLEVGLDSASRAARAAARSADDATKPNLATLKDPGRLAPAVAFASTRGRLPLPVNGVKIREFGSTDTGGGTEKGLSIATRAAAQVTAPCDGWVVYAGPFRSYGQLLILNAGGGYHVLLAGMERISVDLGQFVLTGEPIAVMGSGSQAPATVATGVKQPVLYVEFRKDGAPVDPSPWWATNEVEKVRG